MFPRRFFLFATTPLGPLWTSFIIFSCGHQYKNVGNVRDNFPNVHLSGFTHPKLWSNMLKVLTSLLKRGLHHKLRNCLQIAEDNFSSKTMLTRSNLINLDHNHLGLSLLLDLRSKEDFIGPSMLWKLYSGSIMVKFNCYVV